MEDGAIERLQDDDQRTQTVSCCSSRSDDDLPPICPNVFAFTPCPLPFPPYQTRHYREMCQALALDLSKPEQEADLFEVRRDKANVEKSGTSSNRAIVTFSYPDQQHAQICVYTV